MKPFNVGLFLTFTGLVGLLLIPSLFAAYITDEGTLNPDNTIWNLFAGIFNILRFPTHTLFSTFFISNGPYLFFGGLAFNCLFYGSILERVFSLILSFKK